MNLATGIFMLGNMEKVREHGEKALHLDPDYMFARNPLKMIHRIEGKRSQAGLQRWLAAYCTL
jgi:Tfp pilus assembly protein PilF